MIVRPRLHWLRMLFVWRGSVIHRILPQIALTTGFAALMTAIEGELFGVSIHLTVSPFTLLGIALAVFLGFRNNVSYDRWWEARKLWGALLNDARSLTRQTLGFANADPDTKQRFVYSIIAMIYAVKHQLRGTDARADLSRFVPGAWMARVMAARFKPAVIQCLLVETLRELKVESPLQLAFDRTLTHLNDSFGGCERIAATPIPFAYSVLLHRTAYLYCFLLPFGLVDTVGFFTPVIVAFVSYTFFALEALAEEIQEPFGTEANDLALDAMSTMIEITVREMLGESDLPTPIQADNYFLR